MRVSPYVAIVIGSKNMLMKVYEISAAKGIRTIDEIRYEYELGKEAYFTRKITFAQIEEICSVLEQFQQRMKESDVTEFHCYATSAIRNAKNQVSVLNQIKVRTGIDVIMLSNSELRFLMYKGIQVLKLDFNKIIEKNTAILDIGSGSVQISLFDKQVLYMTQNLDIGTAKVREFSESVENNVLDYISVLEEYIQYEVDMFKSGYLKDKDIKNVIAIGDEIKNINRLVPELHLEDTMSYEQIQYIYKKIKKASYQDIAIKYGLSMEDARMVLPSVLVYKTFLERSKADTIYICSTNLCDGSVVDYAQKMKKIKVSHDFYQDIIASARYIGKRYRYSKIHAQYIAELALEIFDKTKRFHGLTQRDRLILEISAILHATTDVALCVPLVLYNTQELPDTDELETAFWREEYLRIAKLSSILRLANALDRGHKQKFENCSMMRKGQELIITLETNQDITLEITRFSKKAEMFSEFTDITPVLKQRRAL